MRVAKAKPCPFCGSASSFTERMDLSMWQRVCNDCFTHGPSVHDEEDESLACDDEKADAYAVRAWNKRKRPINRAG